MKGAIRVAKELVDRHPDYFPARQFDNPANVKIHRETTGPEIVKAIESLGGTLDGFVAGIGTGGTITGAGEVLRKHYPSIHIAAVELRHLRCYRAAIRARTRYKGLERVSCREYWTRASMTKLSR